MYFWFYATWAELDMLVAMCSLYLPYSFYDTSFFIENWKLGQKTLRAAINDWFLGLGKTRKWSFVNLYDSKCKSSWICKLHFNIAAILYDTQVPLNNIFPFGSKWKIPVNSEFARLSWWKMKTLIYACKHVSGYSCELHYNVHSSIFFDRQIRMQNFCFFSSKLWKRLFQNIRFLDYIAHLLYSYKVYD